METEGRFWFVGIVGPTEDTGDIIDVVDGGELFIEDGPLGVLLQKRTVQKY